MIINFTICFQEYQALVSAQNGNPVIPTDQKQLLSKYLETLYGNEKKSTGVTPSIATTSATNLAEQTSTSMSYQTVSSSQTTSTTETPSISSMDFAELDNLDKQVQHTSTTIAPQASKNIKPYIQPNYNDATSNSQPSSPQPAFSNEDLAELNKLDSQYRPSSITVPKTTTVQPNQPISNRNIPIGTNNNNQIPAYNNSPNNQNYNHNEQTTPGAPSNNNALSQIIDALDTRTSSRIVPVQESAEEREAAKIRAQKAEYSYGFVVNDNMSGNSQQRVEKRKNGKVYGRYSYDDGNYFVTRYYIADGNGFRIVK